MSDNQTFRGIIHFFELLQNSTWSSVYTSSPLLFLFPSHNFLNFYFFQINCSKCQEVTKHHKVAPRLDSPIATQFGKTPRSLRVTWYCLEIRIAWKRGMRGNEDLRVYTKSPRAVPDGTLLRIRA